MGVFLVAYLVNMYFHAVFKHFVLAALRSGVCMCIFLFPCVVFLFGCLPFPWYTVDLLSSVTEVFQSRQDGQVADSGLAEKNRWSLCWGFGPRR